MVQQARKRNETDEERRNRALAIMTAPGWNPNPGDGVSGTVVAMRRGSSEYQPDGYPVLVIEQEDNTFVAVHAFHTILYKMLSDIRPKVGSRLAIQFAGKKVTNKTKDLAEDKQQTVAVYAVIDLDNPEAVSEDFDWGSDSGSNDVGDPDF